MFGFFVLRFLFSPADVLCGISAAKVRARTSPLLPALEILYVVLGKKQNRENRTECVCVVVGPCTDLNQNRAPEHRTNVTEALILQLPYALLFASLL